jgi:DNA-binding beta-propeller fold protein YncE
MLLACSPAAPITHVVEHHATPAKPPARLGDFEVMHLATGADITPRAAPGSRMFELDPHNAQHPEMRAGYAVSLALSPDRTTLALLTSGYNQLEDEKGLAIEGTRAEYVFIYDVSRGEPALKQIVTLANAFVGLAFGGDGLLFASGGPDDAVHVIERQNGVWSATRTIQLGHKTGLGVSQGPLAAGIAVSADGARVVVANHENDTLSVFDPHTATVTEIALRPGGGLAGGEFPMGVALVGSMAYVVAQRDREIVEVDLDARKVTRRLAVGGQPVRVIARHDGTKLYVSNANTDDVAIVDRAHFTVDSRIAVGGPPGSLAATLRGASPNALSLSPDEKSLLVTLGGANAIAIVDLDALRVSALVPTGFYPNDVVVRDDMIYCAYGKSPTGANPKGPWFDDARVHAKPFSSGGGNQSSLQLHHGGLHVFPRPDAEVATLLTARAIENEHLASPPPVPPIFAALRGKVKRVVYVIAENRTFDQILGDVPGLDGDPKLVHWNASITPNQHALATGFVGFDRFFDSGGVSGDGWQWSTAGRTTDVAEKEIPLMYAGRGPHTYDWEGKNRGINVSIETAAKRRAENPITPDDDDLMPGSADVAAVDRPREGGTGYLWDAAKAAGLRVRNYGFFIDDARYGFPKESPAAIAPIREPFASKTRVAYATALGLANDTDPYFRGYDATFPDFWRAREWKRELAEFDRAGDMPELVLVRLPHDHIGAFARRRRYAGHADRRSRLRARDARRSALALALLEGHRRVRARGRRTRRRRSRGRASKRALRRRWACAPPCDLARDVHDAGRASHDRAPLGHLPARSSRCGGAAHRRRAERVARRDAIRRIGARRASLDEAPTPLAAQERARDCATRRRTVVGASDHRDALRPRGSRARGRAQRGPLLRPRQPFGMQTMKRALGSGSSWPS